MAKTKKELHEGIRAKFLSALSEWLIAQGEEVLRTKTNEIALPTLDEEGNEEWLVLSVKVPTGSRDGEPYDGYGEAESYRIATEQKAEAARVAAEKKARKIAKDEKTRAAKAEAKARHEAATANEGEGEGQ